jgi:hypothetical protein
MTEIHANLFPIGASTRHPDSFIYGDPSIHPPARLPSDHRLTPSLGACIRRIPGFDPQPKVGRGLAAQATSQVARLEASVNSRKRVVAAPPHRGEAAKPAAECQLRLAGAFTTGDR